MQVKTFRILHWNEFLYTLHCIEMGKTIEDAILRIKEDKEKIDSIVFYNEEEEILPNTCYSYLRSFLEEAGIIAKISPSESKLLEEAELFFSQIGI